MTQLPKPYAWLGTIGPLPFNIAKGLELLGTQEVVGRGSNKTIMAWRDELNLAGHAITGYSDDDIPWCGLFVAAVIWRAGKAPVANPLWARNWAGYGESVAEKIGNKLIYRNGYEAWLGDVLVFVRDGGGHVAFYIGEDATHFHCLGGNQGNRVSIVRIAKDRCIAVRRSLYKIRPANARNFKLAAVGQVTTNEA